MHANLLPREEVVVHHLISNRPFESLFLPGNFECNQKTDFQCSEILCACPRNSDIDSCDGALTSLLLSVDFTMADIHYLSSIG